MKPVHTHDCDRCTFVAHDIQGNDWYVCSLDQGRTGSIICRYSSVPSANSSYPISQIDKSDLLISVLNTTGKGPPTRALNTEHLVAREIITRFRNMPRHNAVGLSQQINLPSHAHHVHIFDDRGRLLMSYYPGD